MKNLILVLSVISLAFGIFIFSILLYPFFQMGFSTIANEYPNSKVYMLSLIVDNSGISSVEIVGMDLTTKNLVIVSVPKDLTFNGQTISNIYQTYGIKKMEEAIEKGSGIKLTDYMISTKSSLKNYESGLNYNTIGDFLNNLEKNSKLGDPISIFYAFNSFSNNFTSTITLTRFIRLLRFIQTKPVISTISYPSIYLNGSIVTDEGELKNFSMEMENCAPFHNPFSIKPVIVNCTGEDTSIFYQDNWGKWSKNGYNFEIIPETCDDFSGENLVLVLSDAAWKTSALKSALSKIYPKLDFKFMNENDPNFLKNYYMISNWAASNRYYTLGNYDFVVLLGS
ncbi:hypothetical protein [Athalassotoga sp.]|uniref:hypothetical protein n=1 Tax=Athalassotoga sp. TaxID=2022597 RepID=UPI003D07D755